MTYSEKLRHPLWQKKRLKILERDQWKCCSCGSKDKNLQVHHLVYWKRNNPWDYADDCLQTLCDDCHEIRQELTDKAANAVRLALKNVATDKMHLAAEEIIELAKFPDAYRKHQIEMLNAAAEDSKCGLGPLKDGLWSDLLMAVLEVQYLRNEESSERVIRLMQHAVVVLEGKRGSEVAKIFAASGEAAGSENGK